MDSDMTNHFRHMDEFFKRVFSFKPPEERQPKFLVKLTPEEQAAFQEIKSRYQALERDMRRVQGKIQGDEQRLWLTLTDKYKFHGIPATYDEQEGALFEK